MSHCISPDWVILIGACSESYGRISAYDKAYDRVTTKNERALQIPEKTRFNPSTSDDPVMQRVGLHLYWHYPKFTCLQLIEEDVATIYATDSILSMLMCAPRSVFGWDIIVVREGNKLIFDKRDGGSSGMSSNSFQSFHFLITSKTLLQSMKTRPILRRTLRKRPSIALLALLSKPCSSTPTLPSKS